MHAVSLPIQPEALFILYTLQKAGFEAAIVGGAVRDTLLEIQHPTGQFLTPSTDYDFATNARPDEIQALFPESFCENQFGTVSITHEELLKQMGYDAEYLPEHQEVHSDRLIDLQQATKIHVSLADQAETANLSHSKPKTPNFEITTYRSHELYEDFRRPKSLEWGKSLSQDLQRRDFTINALAIQVDQTYLHSLDENWIAGELKQGASHSRFHEVSPDYYTIIDEHNGLQDLYSDLIRTVGDPHERFKEDALRLLRTIRFSVQLNMQIEAATFDALIQEAALIQHVSWERIRDEFLKMLSSEFPREAIQLLDETGILHYILPELLAAKGIEQGGHHTTDVWTHSLDALAECPSKDPIVRFATLLHDVAKPATLQVVNNKPTFYNHEVVGARMAKDIAYRFRLSKKDVNRMYLLVRFHMFHYQPEQTDAAVRRFMRKVGLENIDDILDLREGDRLGSGARKTSWRLEEMKQRMREQLHQPASVSDLAINGHDLEHELQLKPGPVYGKILNSLFEEVLENPELNTKEILLEKAREIVAHSS